MTKPLKLDRKVLVSGITKVKFSAKLDEVLRQIMLLPKPRSWDILANISSKYMRN